MPRRKNRSEPCVCHTDLVLQGAAVTALSRDETALLQQRWRDTFGAGLAKAAGISLSDQKGCDWHVFSSGLVRRLEGEEAVAAYRARNHTELVVLPCSRTSLRGARCRCSAVPWLDSHGDVYLCPESFAWTMVFTHEKGWLGPYFCRASWVAARGRGGWVRSGQGPGEPRG